MANDAHDSPERLRQEVRDIWDQNADFWDERMGEGNDFHTSLIEPTQLRLLDLNGTETILDAACGNGQFARKMADLGACVVGVDVSEQLIEKAKGRSAGYEDRIEFRVIDCTNREQLLAVGGRCFDKIVCTMALMDMPEVQPLVSATAKLLKAGGYFVFSVLHPCFNYELARQGVEQQEVDGELVREYFVRVSRYSRPSVSKGVAMIGQPVPQYYFHRPMSVLLNAFFSESFVLDALEEPVFGENTDKTNLFNMVYQEIPPALVARMRLSK